ncbi:hypothetical protein TcCL_Unassigned03574 [Trypanosoma cruzi]|nr:hypothetical protein TcCL_Unassigned03574 [Trypanosoma cruzi]
MPAHSHKRSSTAGPQPGRWVASRTHKRSTARTVRSPPSALSRPEPSRPRAIAEGTTNNRRRGPSAPLTGKKAEEMRACQQHSQQRNTQRDKETKSDSRYGNYKTRCRESQKNKKQKMKHKKV